MYEAMRDALIADIAPAWAAAFPVVPIVFDNEPFNWGAPPERFFTCEIKFYDGDQVGMSLNPKTRTYGYVYGCAHVRRDLGSKEPLQWTGWFADHLKYRTIAGLQLQAPRPESHQPPPGFYTEDVKLAFFSIPT